MTKAPAKPNDKEKTQRRVYVLPTELVDRITAYQAELGLASEVEAVRRLLDGALKSRDSAEMIVSRLFLQFRVVRSLREAARDVLVDHPKVTKLSFEGSILNFELSDGFSIEVNSEGFATIFDENRNIYDFKGKTPAWASTSHKRYAKGLDPNSDEVPF